MKKIRPCVKCCSEDITVRDCGYSSFNTGHAVCNNCGNKVNVSICDNRDDIIDMWNIHNPTFEEKVKQLNNKILKIQQEIDELTKVHMEHRYGEQK